MPYASVNGLSLYYEIHGTARADAPPLVLLHGGGSTIETSFASVLPLLAKQRQVIAFDQHGHGRTADVDRPFTFTQSADDAAALLESLGIAQADFFGLSNGGQIAIEIALRHPKIVRRLVIASAMLTRDGAPAGFWDGFAHATLDNMPAELKDEYVRVAPNPENLQSMHDKCVERMVHFRGWTADALRSITAPVLILIGDADVATPEHAVEMFRLFPDAQLAVLPGTDHMQMAKRGEWQAMVVEDFLAAHRSTGK